MKFVLLLSMIFFSVIMTSISGISFTEAYEDCERDLSSITDKDGNPVTKLRVGEEYFIKYADTGYKDVLGTGYNPEDYWYANDNAIYFKPVHQLKSFVYIVQILNSEGYVIEVANKESKWEKWELSEMLQWVPQESGTYRVEIFLWDNLTHPSSLTRKHVMIVDVNNNADNLIGEKSDAGNPLPQNNIEVSLYTPPCGIEKKHMIRTDPEGKFLFHQLEALGIHVFEGDRLKITLRNANDGMHDFIIDELDVHSKRVVKKGDEVTVEFNATKSGAFVAYCSVHGDAKESNSWILYLSVGTKSSGLPADKTAYLVTDQSGQAAFNNQNMSIETGQTVSWSVDESYAAGPDTAIWIRGERISAYSHSLLDPPEEHGTNSWGYTFKEAGIYEVIGFMPHAGPIPSMKMTVNVKDS